MQNRYIVRISTHTNTHRHSGRETASRYCNEALLHSCFPQLLFLLYRVQCIYCGKSNCGNSIRSDISRIKPLFWGYTVYSKSFDWKGVSFFRSIFGWPVSNWLPSGNEPFSQSAILQSSEYMFVSMCGVCGSRSHSTALFFWGVDRIVVTPKKKED